MTKWNAIFGTAHAQRKLMAVALLVVLALPFLSALFALTPGSDSDLPICCRRNGKHHCTMSMEERSRAFSNRSPHFQAPVEKCPYCPDAVASTQPHPLAEPPIAAAIFGELVSHPAGLAQTDARRRISRDRSNQKRGPPSSLFA